MTTTSDESLQALCIEENQTGNYLSACYELFRRALFLRQSDNFTRIYMIYRNRVAGWIIYHAALPATGETVDFFVNHAFSILYQYAQGDNFQRFKTVPHILKFMKVCIGRYILKFRQPQTLSWDDLEWVIGAVEPDADTDFDRIEARIRQLIPEERDQMIFEYRFIRQMMPAAISKAEPALGTPEEIRARVKTIRRHLEGDPLLRRLILVD